MGIRMEIRQSDTQKAPLVAFDFDGTLTVRDSFVAFLRWRVGAPAFLVKARWLTPSVIAFVKTRDRGGLKAAAARLYLGDISREAMAEAALRFAIESFDHLIRPDALACWRRWRADGARLVIVTASPEILIAPFAERLGADDLIGSRLEFDATGRFTGRLAGANCRGPEKVARLEAAYGGPVRLAAAYGDTAGDREMLAIADAPGLRVFRGRP